MHKKSPDTGGIHPQLFFRHTPRQRTFRQREAAHLPRIDELLQIGDVGNGCVSEGDCHDSYCTIPQIDRHENRFLRSLRFTVCPV